MKNIVSDKILKQVSKPTRYLGNEWNSVIKNLEKINIRFCFCFPDLYEVGMSHLGLKILYELLNNVEDVYCERVFSPWVDMEEKMRQNDIPLFSLETHTPVKQFDMLGFTLQYEMSYTNIINALDLGQIPLLSTDRTEGDPFVCAGGPCAYNPEPLADFIDFFVIGEAEEIIFEVMDVYRNWKNTNKSRVEFLDEISNIQGVYVPRFYNVEYNSDDTIKSFQPTDDKYPNKIKKRIVKDLDKTFHPEKFIVPYMSIVHDRSMLEVFRGCVRGCRFCQAGMIYRPKRERSVENLLQVSDKLQESTGYEEMSLASLSTSDYTNLEQLTTELIKRNEPKKVNLSLPSLRVDSFSLKLMQQVQKVRKSGLTFAPEAGTQRLRDVINKGVNEQDLMNSLSIAFENGYHHVKLYFMIGLPTETSEDIQGISELAYKSVDTFFSIPKQNRASKIDVTVSTSSFVPKPFTPFQWEGQDEIEVLNQKQQLLKSKIKSKHIKYNWHESKLSFFEAVFSLGDRRLSQVLIKAWENGCNFDGWSDHFDYNKWMSVFNECNIDPHFYANRKKSFDEVLPWDFIDIGVTKSFLISENKNAHEAITTPNCRDKCSGCGVATFGGGVCVEKNSG